MFTSAMAISRIASIAGASWMARVHRLTIIECKNEAEIRGVERLLGSMPGIVIGKRRGWGGGKMWVGRRYSGGWAVDEHRNENGWVKLSGFAALQLVLAMPQYGAAWFASAIVTDVDNLIVPSALLLAVVGCDIMMQMRGGWGVFLRKDEEEMVEGGSESR
ncbi:hypothetical protein BZA77DRAFT_325551 [Pyronema omphalodes]|nr:hypothetical protein BZA77DRAFT_325551 [Pyronema omphalodes]